jgi:hypothetical protein
MCTVYQTVFTNNYHPPTYKYNKNVKLFKGYNIPVNRNEIQVILF